MKDIHCLYQQLYNQTRTLWATINGNLYFSRVQFYIKKRKKQTNPEAMQIEICATCLSLNQPFSLVLSICDHYQDVSAEEKLICPYEWKQRDILNTICSWNTNKMDNGRLSVGKYICAWKNKDFSSN